MKLLVILLIFIVACQARYIQPGNIDPDEIIFEEINDADGDMTIADIHNMKPTRFVPLNSVQFFKTYDLCEDGFKMDVLGICREVWD